MGALDLLRLRASSRLLDAPPPRLSNWSELDAALPDHGFPNGITELTSSHALGGATSVALALVRSAQLEAHAWCAWIDSEATLYAPAVAKAGVDLGRLFVVRPPEAQVGHVAVKVARSRACEVIVVDLSSRSLCGERLGRRWVKPEVWVRRLALAAEESGASILLLTDALVPRAMPLPVSLRLELARASDHLIVKVAKDRRGRAGLTKAIVPLRTCPGRSLDGLE